MASPRVPLANWCPVCAAKAPELEQHRVAFATLAAAEPTTATAWTCRACGSSWSMTLPIAAPRPRVIARLVELESIGAALVDGTSKGK